MKTLKLNGFNNLAKSLTVSFYKIQVIDSVEDKQRYKQVINTEFDAGVLQQTMENYATKIGGAVLHSSKQNYRPQGASVNVMVAEGVEDSQLIPNIDSVISHMDKSHLCIHTYPEEKFYGDSAIFRADIDLSTCGVLSPLYLLSTIFQDYEPDVAHVDYKVRGLNRCDDLSNQYLDHEVNTIGEFLSEQQLNSYHFEEFRITQANLFHAKFMKNTTQNSVKVKHLIKSIYDQS